MGTNGRRFVAALSELRNNLVHDVRNSEFVLAEWVTTLDSAQLKRFAVSFSPSETLARESAHLFQSLKKAGSELSPQATVEAVVDRAREKPKPHIWLGAYGVLSGMLDMYGYSEYRQWAKAGEVLRDEE